VSDVVDRLAAPGDEPDHWAGTATVSNAAAGTTADGRKLIGITWQGVAHTCCYLASYTPAMNDNVVFIKSGGSVMVLGKPAI
jgi:hypothetical protein